MSGIENEPEKGALGISGFETGIPMVHRKAESYRMFDRIYKRYDLLNHLFSLGQDFRWRQKAVGQIGSGSEQILLDLATGTGDVAFTILSQRREIFHVYGCDMALKMLEIAQRKAFGKKLEQRISFIQGDASCIPFETQQFHVVTMAFGIRNMVDPLRVLREMYRVLKPGGQVLILEFSMPAHRLTRGLHLFYLRKIIPAVGALVSRDKQAYRYLNETIETFPYGQSFCNMMKEAGFLKVSFTPLTFGVVTLYQGEKNEAQL